VVGAATGLLVNDLGGIGPRVMRDQSIGTFVVPDKGTVMINADGSFSVLPEPDFVGLLELGVGLRDTLTGREDNSSFLRVTVLGSCA
jgi:hypothetical protein